MNYKCLVLVGIVLCQCALVIFLGYRLYHTIVQRQNVLGVSHVTSLKKEYLIFPQGASYSAFYEPKPNVDETNEFSWASGSATYTINADGLNERFDYAVQKTPHVYRIIALGDSFTFGHYVNTADNWTEVLEDQLNSHNPCPDVRKYEVLNLGVRGYDLDFAAERFRIRGQKYNPDLVLWFINNHHFTAVRELITSREQKLTNQMSEEEVKRLNAAGNYFPALEQAISEMNQKYSVDRLREQENAAFYHVDTYHRGPLMIISNNIESRNMALVKIFRNYRSSKTYIMQDIANIKEISDAEFSDGHPSALGHQIYAKEIYEYIVNQQVICR